MPPSSSSPNAKLAKRKARPSNRHSFESVLDFEVDGELVAIPDDSPPLSTIHRSEILRRPTPSSNTRRPVRMDAQDGPWSVSVAEAPHDPRAYILYVKTPTMHLTLTRTASEIHTLHAKLRDAYPSLSLPSLPLDAADGSLPFGKRRSSFLHTLSRFTSPGPKQRVPTTPLPMGRKDINGDDPFVDSPQSVTTSLAAYLTHLSNDQVVRVSKPWRRFVRVRTDDLESVRVERAIKRVRSDLAMHAPVPTLAISDLETPEQGARGSAIGGASATEEVSVETQAAEQQSTPDAQDKSLLEDENTAAAAAMATLTPTASPLPSPLITPAESISSQAPIDETAKVSVTAEDAKMTEPPTASKQPHRIPRSASADPDKSSRLSRQYKSSVPNAETDDEGLPRSSRKRKGDDDQPRKSKKVAIEDFEMMRVLGKGCAGKVLLVRHKASQDLYALKAITKRHVLAHQELLHTLTEQAVLKRMAREGTDPFVVKLWWSFHDKENLFLVMDFHPGGDLATQLARWGRLGRDRARFYAAEIVEGVEGLHAAGVIYRDLKPENILIGLDGHIVLTDFGLSKEFPRASDGLSILPTAPATPSGSRTEYHPGSESSSPTPYWMKGENGSAAVWSSNRSADVTSTFCGTAEYLAPEVIQGLPYSFEVDWWSFGTMLFEMLTGITPFWANNHSDMYVRVLQDELQFPEDKSMDQDTRSLIRGLLQRNPVLRIKEPRIKKHPYFSMIDWGHVYHKRYIPPYIPPIDAANPSDTQNFDDAFLDMDPTLDNEAEPESLTTDSERERTDDDRTDGEDSVKTPAQSHSPSVHPVTDDTDTVDVFDGYSFKGRHSVLLDDEDEGYQGPDEDEDMDDSEAAPLDGISGIVEEEEAEAKTPEAKPSALPQVIEREGEEEEGSIKETISEMYAEKPPSSLDDGTPSILPSEQSELNSTFSSVPPTTGQARMSSEGINKQESGIIKGHRNRREKSGVPALDRNMADGDGDILVKDDEEDDDWDLVEAPGGEDRNGARGTTLFARGVVDKYRLAVFRRASSSTRPKRQPRYPQATPNDRGGESLETNTVSPSPSEKRNGRNTGLNFRTPKQFLRTRSPPASLSPSTGGRSKSSLAKGSVTVTGAPTLNRSAAPSSTSLRSKPSSTSVAITPSGSQTSVPAGTEDQPNITQRDTRISSGGEDQSESKIKKIKKNYKEGAEKVLSLFTPTSRTGAST